MPELTLKNTIDSIATLLKELFLGPDTNGVWVINSSDSGLLPLLGKIDHAQASRVLIEGRSGISGHASHLLFHLGLINRALKGENAFANADWKGSLKRVVRDEKEWRGLLDELNDALKNTMKNLSEPFEYDQIALTGTIALAVHVGYHFGAIRQLMGLL
jgi:hypothetical protein